MMLRLVADVNGMKVGEIRIRNCGHPHAGDHPPDDDLRLYKAIVFDQDSKVIHQAEVFHRRDNGWLELVREVTDSMGYANEPYSQPSPDTTGRTITGTS